MTRYAPDSRQSAPTEPGSTRGAVRPAGRRRWRSAPGIACCLRTVGRCLAALLVPIVLFVGAAPGSGGPQAAAGPAGESRIVGIAPDPDGVLDVQVYSAAMDTVLAVKVLRARDTAAAAPALYLLNGAAGGHGASSWHQKTDIRELFAGEQVNVVIPLGGSGSYFTDWQHDDPVLGRQQWTTFLTQELPPLIDEAFNGTGVNAVAGISMAATSVFQLALAAPGRYVALGSYSGCVRTSDPMGRMMVRSVVGRWGGDATNMWGPWPSPAWTANDPYLHAEELRGITLYVSTGTGLPGPLETLQGSGIGGDIGKLVDQAVVGGLLEAVTNHCAHTLRDRLNELGIPAVFDLRPNGTHSWGYWEHDLHRSWPLFRDALARGQ
ncbi:alpha/beta hydrolase [Nocardia sp. CA-290969]|uniref:alpha/beta hydrolase n=1 Tax=Nocardia sp. CA-290969 TaxID=3239986 RepID=UPI003D8B97BE